MRRRVFWSMLTVAVVALVLTGLVTTVLGQAIVGRQTRAEMQRQAVVARALILERLAEVDGSGRLFGAIVEGQASRGQAAEIRDDLDALIVTARRLLGADMFDIGLVTRAGEVVLLSERSVDRFGFDPASVVDGGQFLTSETDSGERMLVLASPLGEPRDDRGTAAMVIIGRRSTLLDFGAIVRVMLAAVLVAAVLSAVAARLLSRGVTAGLAGLAGAARSLAAGDPSARVPIDGPDEVAAVAEQFNEMADLLSEAQDRERQFLMSVGHDLRTPLTTIAGYAEMLDDGIGDPEETARIAAVLLAETSRLRRLVEDLMLLARLEAREFTLEPEPVDVGAHLGELVEGFRPRAEAARIRLEVEIAATAPIRTDADRVAQITANLLENALRYTPEAGVVRLHVADTGRGVRIDVADTGTGIDEADLPHVFEKFYVARRYRRVRPEGSGLGLSVVRQLADALGAGLSVVSSSEAGTTVSVTVPSLDQRGRRG